VLGELFAALGADFPWFFFCYGKIDIVTKYEVLTMKTLKQVLILAASPRKNGNSTILALKAADGVKAEGGQADVVLIAQLKIAPCNACNSCIAEPGTGCIIMDDMQPLYEKIKGAQGIIFATPVYWFNISAQMKLLIDRAYAIQDKGCWAFTGKDVGVILTYGDEDVFTSGGVNALRSFQDILAFSKANLVGAVYGTANKAGDVQTNKELLQEAYELGRKLVNPK
jgi:multimeric flavodoxin WrbA